MDQNSQNKADIKTAPSSLPAQKLPMSKKGKQWRRDTLDYYINYKNNPGSTLRSDRARKVINYDLYNGVVNQGDVQQICDPLGYTGSTWADRFQHYDKISEPLRLLIGDETGRPDTALVISEGVEDINRKVKGSQEKILAALQAELMAHIDPSTVDPNNPPPKPEEVAKNERYSPSDMLEKKANKILKVLKKRANTKWIFTQGFKDALIAGEEIYWTGIMNGEPALRKANPLNLTIILDDDSMFVDDAIAVIEQRMLSIPTIIDEFGDEMEPADIDKLNALNISGYGLGFQPGNEEGPFGGFVNPAINNGMNGALRVMRVEWYSLKQVGTLKYTEENTGEQVEELVDETFKSAFEAFKEFNPDASVEWFWINEAWEGVKIGTDVYLGIKPKANQRRRMDNPYYCKLGYTGFIYEATNSRSVSLIDRLKPYQYLYDIIAFRLEMAFASDQGKVFLMDLAQIPRSEGIDLEKWIYYLKEMKIGFVNSFEEGRKHNAGKNPQFNQFQSIDLSLSQSIQQYINYLDHIQAQMYNVAGVSPQRMASISNSELVGNVEKSIQQSSIITEYLFEAHNEVKRRVYTALIEVAKIAWRKGKTMQYVNDDLAIEILNIEEFEFENSDLAVFVSNLAKDREIKSKIDALAQVAMEQQKADLSTIIDTILNDSPKDIANILRNAEQASYKREQDKAKQEQDAQGQQLQQQQQHEQMLQAHQDSEKQKDRDLKMYEVDENNSTKIQVQELANYFKNTGGDENGNGIADPLEIAQHALDLQNSNREHFMNQENLAHEKKKHEDTIGLKSGELVLKNKALAIQKKDTETKAKAEANKIKVTKQIADNKDKTTIRVAKMKPKPSLKKK